MRRICAWCEAVMPMGPENPDPVVTHGICGYCALKLASAAGIATKELLDRIQEPVVVIAADRRLSSANRAARDLLGKGLDEVNGQLPGDAFGCKNARLPGGCGVAPRCGTCALRMTVAETVATGRSHNGVPAFLNKENRSVVMRISTEKAGSVVLLRIDDVREV